MLVVPVRIQQQFPVIAKRCKQDLRAYFINPHALYPISLRLWWALSANTIEAWWQVLRAARPISGSQQVSTLASQETRTRLIPVWEHMYPHLSADQDVRVQVSSTSIEEHARLAAFARDLAGKARAHVATQAGGTAVQIAAAYAEAVAQEISAQRQSLVAALDVVEQQVDVYEDEDDLVGGDAAMWAEDFGKIP